LLGYRLEVLELTPPQPIHHINFDINLLGDCDVIVAELARRAGWTLTHKMIPEGHENEVSIVNEIDHVYSVKARGPASQPIKSEIKHEAFDSVVKKSGQA
jgi:NAD-dependent histone deacetylase SIR2